MRCNVCRCREFVDFRGRGEICCRMCKSIERTRLLWMYLEDVQIDDTTKVLHLAPERGIYNRLRERIRPENYVVCDFQPERYAFVENCTRIDLCDLDAWPSDEFDLVVHSHVMEHVPCNIAYPLFHLHRMLKPTGIHLCVIPFMNDRYEESFRELSAEERKLRFGQHDHMRRFGCEDIDAHLGKLLRMPAMFDATRDFSEEKLASANIPSRSWRGFHMDTVLRLKKYDMRLLQPPLSVGASLLRAFGVQTGRD